MARSGCACQACVYARMIGEALQWVAIGFGYSRVSASS